MSTLPTLRVLSYDVPPIAIPLTAAAVAAAVAVFVLQRERLGRRLASAVATFWVLFTAALTLSPASPLASDLTRRPHVGCQLDPGLHSLDQVLATGDDWMNVVLYVPLGILVVLLPRRHRRAMIVALFFAPPLVETFQALAASFFRTCQTKDVLTNWSGALIGILLGLLVGRVARLVRGARHRHHAAVRRR